MTFAWVHLVWLADDMAMGGMDMTGYRMIPAGQALMMPGKLALAADRICLRVRHVGCDDDRHDDALDGADNPSLRTGWTPSIRRPAVRLNCMACGRLFAGVGRLLATSAQWALERAALLTPMMASASKIVAAIPSILAGLYQWTPLKDVCLSQCQAPLGFILSRGGFQRAATSSLMLGIRHGVYCLGCCWALMVLLLALGVMNLFWITALAILVLLEKLMPSGRVIARNAGIAFFGRRVWMLFLPS
jgi:predicted metal-binding membrane protein